VDAEELSGVHDRGAAGQHVEDDRGHAREEDGLSGVFVDLARRHRVARCIDAANAKGVAKRSLFAEILRHVGDRLPLVFDRFDSHLTSKAKLNRPASKSRKVQRGTGDFDQRVKM